jgi:NAD-dependent deacetylase
MSVRKKIVVLSGAGISAESGIKTFRDTDGLWEGHSIEEVATYDGWLKNPALVQDFYNQRRLEAKNVKPNDAHYALAKLEKKYDVQIITQNVDNLHERAGSSKVLHLHGELFKSQSTKNPKLVYDIAGWEIKMGDTCDLGSQLRPFIVWFGEAVPMIEPAVELVFEADIFVVIGTSLVVYPAASLLNYIAPNVPIYVIDPKIPDVEARKNTTFITEKATIGMAQLLKILG